MLLFLLILPVSYGLRSIQSHLVKFDTQPQRLYGNITQEVQQLEYHLNIDCLNNGKSKQFVLIRCRHNYFLNYLEDYGSLDINQTVQSIFQKKLDHTTSMGLDAEIKLCKNLLVTFISLHEPASPQKNLLNFRFLYKNEGLSQLVFNKTFFTEDYKFIDLDILEIDDYRYLVVVANQIIQEQQTQVDLRLGLVIPNEDLSFFRSMQVTVGVDVILKRLYIHLSSQKQVILVLVFSNEIRLYELQVTTTNVKEIKQLSTLDLKDLSKGKIFHIDFEDIQFIDGLMFLQYDDRVILYSLKPISLEVELIKCFYLDQLHPQRFLLLRAPSIGNLKAILIEEEMSKSLKVYGIYSQNVWYQRYVLQYLQNLQSPMVISSILMENNLRLILDESFSMNLTLYSLCTPGFKARMIIQDTQIFLSGCEICNATVPLANLNKYEDYVNHNPLNSLECFNDCKITVQRVKEDYPRKANNSAYLFCQPLEDCEALDLSNSNISFDNKFLLQQFLTLPFNSQTYILEQYYARNLQKSQFFYNDQDLSSLSVEMFQEIQKKKNISQKLASIPLNSCVKPCYPFYEEEQWNLGDLLDIVPYQNECVLSSQLQYYKSMCSQFINCYECGHNPWCHWVSEICVERNSEIIPKSLSGLEQCRPVQICLYNIKAFNTSNGTLRLDQLNNYVSASQGDICSWFVEFGEIKTIQIILNISLGFIQNDQSFESLNSWDLYICLLSQADHFTPCEQRLIQLASNGSNIILTESMSGFRFFIQFRNIVTLNPMRFEVIYEEVGKTLKQDREIQWLQIVFWFAFSFMLLMYLCFRNRRRIPRLVFGTFEFEFAVVQNQQIEVVPIPVDEVKQRINDMLEQGSINRYPFDESLLLFGQQQCSFCLEKYELDDILIQFFCGHLFHQECFETWLSTKGNLEKCPVCNQMQNFIVYEQFRIQTFLDNKEYFINHTSILLYQEYKNKTETLNDQFQNDASNLI